MENREESSGNNYPKKQSVKDAPLRLQVYLARCGVGSRRTCERYIEKGRVRVNGVTVTTQGVKVTGEDLVCFDGHKVEPETTLRYIALHKPPRYISSSFDPEGRPLAVDLLYGSFEERLYNVGRLDFMSEGLLLFTNDGT
ncbi:MAG: S4 domain-containing protein, partial [Spirochaetia bacterium]